MKQEEEFSAEFYGSIHKLINQCEFLVPVAATSALGASVLGTQGLALGLLGAIDVGAQYYKIYDKAYLTSMVMGAVMMNSFKLPYYFSGIAGASIGLLLQSYINNEYLEMSANPILGAIYGYSYLPFSYGACLGFSLGIIDELMSYNDINNDYLFTLVARNFAATKLITPQIIGLFRYNFPAYGSWIDATEKTLETLLIQEMIAVAISAMIFPYRKFNSKKKQSFISLSKDLYNLYAQIIPTVQLDQMIQTAAITSISSQIILNKILLTFTRYSQNNQEKFININSSDEKFKEFIDTFSTVCLYLVPHVLSNVLVNYLNGYFNTKFALIMSDKLHNDFLTEDISLLLSKNRTENLVSKNVSVFSNQLLINKMSSDINIIAHSSLLSNALLSHINGIHAIGHLFSINAINMLVYSSIYNGLINRVTNNLSNIVNSYSNNIDELNVKIENKFDYVKRHSESMIIYDASNFTRTARKILVDEKRNMIAEQNIWSAILNIWLTAANLSSFLFTKLLIATQIYQKHLLKEYRDEILLKIENFSKMKNWKASNIAELYKLQQSIARILELKARMDNTAGNSKHKLLYVYRENDVNGICLNNFKFGRGNESQITVDNLCMFNKIVAIKGVTGSGKTTLFKVMKQIINEDIWSEGELIYFSKNKDKPYIVMTSQNTYMPPGDSLIELITFKKGAEVELYREKVIGIIKELELNNTNQSWMLENLDVVKNWNIETSGGEKKKIEAIRLLMLHYKMQPDFIFLDEVFAGMDQSSINSMQVMFNKYFDNSQIFVIDHEWESHNFNKWYSGLLVLSNNTLQVYTEGDYT